MKINFKYLIIFTIIVTFCVLKTEENFGRSIGQTCKAKTKGMKCNIGLRCLNGRCGNDRKIDRYENKQENKDAKRERKQTRAEKMGMGAYIGIGIGVAVCIGVVMMLRSKAR